MDKGRAGVLINLQKEGSNGKEKATPRGIHALFGVFWGEALGFVGYVFEEWFKMRTKFLRIGFKPIKALGTEAM